jgi:hypothetical protein
VLDIEGERTYMDADSTSKVIKPNFRSAKGAHKVEKKQKTKRQLLEEMDAIRQRLMPVQKRASPARAMSLTIYLLRKRSMNA